MAIRHHLQGLLHKLLSEGVRRIRDDVSIPFLVVEEKEICHLSISPVNKIPAYDLVAVSDKLSGDMTLAT